METAKIYFHTIAVTFAFYPYYIMLASFLQWYSIQPNKETMAAMLEAERIARDSSVKRYSDVEEALRALKE